LLIVELPDIVLLALPESNAILQEEAPTISDTQPPQASDPMEIPDIIEDERHSVNALSEMV
jgi:hypothetical protein